MFAREEILVKDWTVDILEPYSGYGLSYELSEREYFFKEGGLWIGDLISDWGFERRMMAGLGCMLSI